MSDLIPKHGGYRKLKGFQVAQLVYDITILFVEKYVDRFSRTQDQMVQAARSGVQNIAEGSQASATSKKTELKLTQVARASLEELKLDYEDFLRQRNLPLLAPRDPVLMRFKKKRPQTLRDFRLWVKEEYELQQMEKPVDTDRHGQTQTSTDEHGQTEMCTDGQGQTRTSTDEHGRTRTGTDNAETPCADSTRPCPPECFVANGALSLLNLACWFLGRQVEQLAAAFEDEGGFTERLYKVRTAKRRNN